MRNMRGVDTNDLNVYVLLGIFDTHLLSFLKGHVDNMLKKIILWISLSILIT